MKRFGRFPIDDNEFDTAGELECKRCKGTGTNPDYWEVNVIQTAINHFGQSCADWFATIINSTNSQAPCCLNCYGLKKIDWVHYANGSYEEAMTKRKEDMRGWFLKDVEPFLRYIHCGEVLELFGSEAGFFHFDWEKQSWVRVNDINHDFSNLRNAYRWLNKFRDEGYFDLSNFSDVAFGYQELYVIDPSYYFEQIKTEILISEKMTIDRLLEIKNEMDLFWYDINHLKSLPTEKVSQAKLPGEFEFTWKGILRKFGLSMEFLSLLDRDKESTLKRNSESGLELQRMAEDRER